MDIVNLIAGIIGIASFIFAIWVWMRYDMRLQEFTRITDSIRNAVSEELRRAEGATIETDAMRLEQADRNLGVLKTIWNITAVQLGVNKSADVLHDLIKSGIVLSGAMIDRLESFQDTTEVWLATPDLKPDSVNKELGRRINVNLKKGKRYVYFYPNNLQDAKMEVTRLYNNIGVKVGQLKDEPVTVVPLIESDFKQLFPQHRNILMVFHDQNRVSLPYCFGEIYFVKVNERGAYWQEHDEATTRSLHNLLNEALENFFKEQNVEKGTVI